MVGQISRVGKGGLHGRRVISFDRFHLAPGGKEKKPIRLGEARKPWVSKTPAGWRKRDE